MNLIKHVINKNIQALTECSSLYLHFTLQQGKMEPSDHHVFGTSMKLSIKKLPHSYPVFKLIDMNVKLNCHGIKIDAHTTLRDRTDCCHLAVSCRCLFSNFDIHHFRTVTFPSNSVYCVLLWWKMKMPDMGSTEMLLSNWTVAKTYKTDKKACW